MISTPDDGLLDFKMDSRDIVESVDDDQAEGDKEDDPGWDDVGGDEEADPGHDDEDGRRQVDVQQVW